MLHTVIPRLTSRRASVLIVIALVALFTASAGQSSVAAGEASTPTTSEATPIARPSTILDELVRIHGARLHVRCAGTGDATVLLLAGFGEGGENWSAIEPSLAQGARVCSYSRFGTGGSDAPPRPQTFSSQAKDLRKLLRVVGEPGPFVVVGHSFGGAEAVTFTKLFASDVRGLLLLDASPATWNKAVCAVRDDGSDAAQDFQELCTTLSDPANNAERLDAPLAFAKVAKIRSLGDLPMIVATAVDHPYGLAPNVEARLTELWNKGQDRWVSLSSSGQLVPVENSSHYIQLDYPDVVIDQVQQLLR